MTHPKGKLDAPTLLKLIESEEVTTVIVAFVDLYGRLVGKRFEADFFRRQVIDHGTHVCNYLVAVDMEMEPVSGYEIANWESGYGDFHLRPDSDTLRLATWLDRTALVICDVMDHSGKQLVGVAPRSLLHAQCEDLQQHGLVAMAGSEVEYYVFQNSFQDAAGRNYHKLTPEGDYIEDYHILQGSRHERINAQARRHLSQSGIPVECTKGEWGLGQHELNLEFARVLEMADRHSIYKQCLKEIADAQGCSVTFMAKQAEEQAGSSCHIHVSLWANQGNVFPGDKKLGAFSCSDTFRWFLGGWLAHAAEFMVFYAPNVNSYKRFQSASWAPTKIAWAHDNRTAGFRIVGSGESLRIECRIPGADCNPYLAYTAALASGLDGIRNRIEPPEAIRGNVYEATDVPAVPTTLGEAIDLFDQSDFVQRAIGPEVKRHYTHFFHTELAAFERAVTDWERSRYFERI